MLELCKERERGSSKYVDSRYGRGAEGSNWNGRLDPALSCSERLYKLWRVGQLQLQLCAVLAGSCLGGGSWARELSARDGGVMGGVEVGAEAEADSEWVDCIDCSHDSW